MTKRLILPIVALLVLAGLAAGWYWVNSNLLAVVDKQIFMLPTQEQVLGAEDSFFDANNILLSVERDGTAIEHLVYASVNPEIEILLTTTAGSPFSRSISLLLQGTGSQTLTAAELPEQAVLAVYKRSGNRPEPLYLVRLK